MMGRVVTVDLDKGPQLAQLAIRAWHYFESEADETEIRVSSSGEGLHIIGKYRETLTDEQVMKIRRHLDDDVNRMRMDEARLEADLPTQVLWTDKHGREGTADRDFEDVYDALDWIGAAITDHDAIHGWAQHGHKSGQYRTKKPHSRDLTHE